MSLEKQPPGIYICLAFYNILYLFIHLLHNYCTYLPCYLPTDLPTYTPTYLPTYIRTYSPTHLLLLTRAS